MHEDFRLYKGCKREAGPYGERRDTGYSKAPPNMRSKNAQNIKKMKYHEADQDEGQEDEIGVTIPQLVFPKVTEGMQPNTEVQYSANPRCKS